MARINYTKTYFNEPGRIDQGTYEALKMQISKNPSFEINSQSETFSQKFRASLTALKIAGGYFVLYLIIFGSSTDSQVPGIFNFLAGISMLTVFFCCFALLLEGPSYATYLKKKSEYFSRLKYAIQNTNSYYEFCISFYGI